MTTRDDLVRLIAVCEKALHSPGRVLLDPAAVLPILKSIASALEAKDAENARLEQGWKQQNEIIAHQSQQIEDCRTINDESLRRISDLERQLAEETERCVRAAIYNLENCGSMIFVQEHGWSGLKERIAAAIRGGAK